MAAEPTDPTTGQPAGLVPAPDETTEQSWADQLVAKGKEMILDWRETKVAYGTMAAFRAQNQIPLIGSTWTQDQDDKYWLLNDVVATLAKYLGEVDEGIRNVAYDTFGDQIAVLGDPGDFKLDYTNGILTVTTTNGKTSVDPAGFVGMHPVLIGIIVVVAGSAVIVGIIELSGVVRDWIKKGTAKDVADQEKRIAEDIIAKGGDPTEAHKTAAQITNDQLSALAAKARADAEAGEKGDLGQLAKVVTTVAYVALGVAVVGAALYFGAPLMSRALAGSEPKRLAQQNPALDKKELERLHDREAQLEELEYYASNKAEWLESEGQDAKQEWEQARAYGAELSQIKNRLYPPRSKRLAQQNPVGGEFRFRVGNRVQLHPATDLWMMGDRYGKIVNITDTRAQVKLDKSGRKFWLSKQDLLPIESSNPARSTRKFVVHMDNMGDEGTVTLTVQGPGALAWAKDEQTIGGSSWESADGPNFAYTVLYDYPGLVADLKEEGYKLDQTEYSPPDEQKNPAGANLSSVSVVRFDAGHDVNGNPRRVYIVMNSTGIIAAIDEGYEGPHVLDHVFGEEIGKKLREKADRGGTIATTNAEYRALRKNFPPSKAKFPSKRGSDTVVLHLRAGHDVNGNPRRVYAVFKGGEIVNVIDEGYRGLGALPWNQQNLIAAQIDTYPAERKALLKQFGG